MSIRHVVLSDLHFGARDSILTHVHGSGEIADGPSEVLAAFANGMLETLGDAPKPHLVLLGDALDLGLSPFGDVSKSFLQLLDAFFPEDGEDLFDREIIYVAGNHDHHLWRIAQDNGFISAIEQGEMPGDLDAVSNIFGHTHKPFQDELLVDGYEVPVAVFNTGGWVLDEPTLMPVQGCAATLVSDDLELASLRLFNDPTDGTIAPVHIEGSGRVNRLADEAGAAVERAASHWASFSEIVHARIVEEADKRTRELLDHSNAQLREAAE